MTYRIAAFGRYINGMDGDWQPAQQWIGRKLPVLAPALNVEPPLDYRQLGAFVSDRRQIHAGASQDNCGGVGSIGEGEAMNE